MKSFAVIFVAAFVGYSSAAILPVPSDFFNNLIHNVETAVHNAANTVQTAVHNAANTVQTAVDNTAAKVEALNQQMVKDVMEAFQKIESLDLCNVNQNSLDCCVTVKNITACSNVIATNGPQGLALSYVLLLNNVTLFRKTIDTSTLPLTQCVPLPQVPSVQLCLTPFDLSLSSDEIGSCFELSAKVATKVLLGVNLHCYQLANQTLAILPPGKGPVQAAVTLDTAFLPTPAPIHLPF